MDISRVIVAIDSFKGSITSAEAGEAVKRSVMRAKLPLDVIVKPLADGGEGTVEAIVSGMNGEYETVTVIGPVGDPVVCTYGLIRENKLAVIELAEVAGLSLVSKEKQNPLYTTTYGLGEVIRHVISKGYRELVIGIGGSATNDGGIGMLQALGFGFLDDDGHQIPYGAAGIKKLKKITTDKVIEELKECKFHIACDVTNPLTGDKGASAVFGPQKGATEGDVAYMDSLLKKYAGMAKKINRNADSQAKGSGAAGGLGFAFKTFLNGNLESGINIVMDYIKLEECIANADLVITGEGHIDEQTTMGKAPNGVAKLASKYNKPVIAFTGGVTGERNICDKLGMNAIFAITKESLPLEEAMKKENAIKNIEYTSEQVFRLLKMFLDIRGKG